MDYRNLSQPGGPEFSEAQVKALAAEAEVQDGPNDDGEMFDRPGRPSDRFVSPYPNDEAARSANGGALPPDLSLMIKARRDGANYLYSLLIGYGEEAPAGVEVREGMNYNRFFTGAQIAMPPPLSEEAVEYSDGTKPTVENMAKDVVTFLAWASEPHMEERKSIGFKVLIYLIILAGLLYATTKKLWTGIKH
jgi:ubiquinol-cytochrome c reductase cytochrome c1 subunit